MSRSVEELHRLLAARAAREQDAAWQEFLGAFSRLLLHTTRSVFRDHDDVMDAYTFVIDSLRANDFARLRGFVDDGRSRFTTWLVVVARRLSLDFQRHRFGRVRADQSEAVREEQLARRRLVRMIGVAPESSDLVAATVGADDAITTTEVSGALNAALDVLPAGDRVLLALRFEEDLSAQRIARILHLPSPFHVYRRLDRIMRTLRRQLESRGIAP